METSVKSKANEFDYSLDYKNINLRKNPELYRIGRGEQGVLLIEPYKSEILPSWKFKSEKIAKASAAKIYKLFLAYIRQNEFVGADMARKFLQMGYTRARRYANHSSGKKYEKNPQKAKSPTVAKAIKAKPLPQNKDWAVNEKAKAAKIFYGYYLKAKANKRYLNLKESHIKSFY